MDSGKFYPLTLRHLLKLILKQYEEFDHVFGIPKKFFFSPRLGAPLQMNRFGQRLQTPIGVAAGPHTQLAQNIVAAWLMGSSFIELKTVQTLDELHISKPCIDMQDEGYNCEWSQELKIHESFNQYLDAWILIHILKDLMHMGDTPDLGVVFNMSVGYNMEGILRDNMQWFFNKMNDASAEIAQRLDSIKDIYPQAFNLSINPQISDNVTLSTMHGCPPDEIEKIGHYLMKEKSLNTVIKLNPTLIGRDRLWEILNRSGFATRVPESAFDHDLKYDDAVEIIKRLSQTANECNLRFGIKLTNTLECENHKQVFPPNETMMYMSGRALHPISVNLAAKLQNDFEGTLNISFCGGADACNISDLVSCGFSPITVCSDILKPGGYGLFGQYVEELRQRFDDCAARNIDDFIIKRSKERTDDVKKCALINLNRYADKVLDNKRYRKNHIHEPSIKTSRPLGFFDCIHAPCVDTCPTSQDIPGYIYYTSQGNLSKAGDIILQTNPFPYTMGLICDHLCQTKCTRINYDQPVMIREIKRYVAETAILNEVSKIPKPQQMENRKEVAIIGAGPSGLSCAYFLAIAGFSVSIYEAKLRSGGMASSVIPVFRLTDRALQNDVKRLEELGVKVYHQYEVNESNFQLIKKQSDYVYIAVGAQRSAKLNIDGSRARGVVDPLVFLEEVKRGRVEEYGNRIAIIGGGNTAMDAARTAYRMVGNMGKVYIVYRRTIKQMPADIEEIRAAQDEGIEVMELTAPERINTHNNRVVSITCSRMRLGAKDVDGRERPEKIPNTEFELEVDVVIPAIGQEFAFDIGNNEELKSSAGDYETQMPNVFIGGDALRGASTAINAIGDGRKVAQIIIDREGVNYNTVPENVRKPMNYNWHYGKRVRKVQAVKLPELSPSARKNFNLVVSTLSEDDVIEEANRCLLCDEFCSVCTTVCPNMANYTYLVNPASYTIQNAVARGNNKVTVEKEGVFAIAQTYQILNIGNFCNECGNCTTFCPSSGDPYRDKPRVFLTQSSFDAVNDGYFMINGENEPQILCKKSGQLSKLSRIGENYIFSNEDVEAELYGDSLKIKNVNFKKENVSEFTNRQAVEMSIIMQGLQQLVFDD